jgi:hypothetical protein
MASASMSTLPERTDKNRFFREASQRSHKSLNPILGCKFIKAANGSNNSLFYLAFYFTIFCSLQVLIAVGFFDSGKHNRAPLLEDTPNLLFNSIMIQCKITILWYYLFALFKTLPLILKGLTRATPL